MTNDPAFWETVGAAIIVIAAVPIVFVIYVAARVLYDAWRSGGSQAQPTVRIVDATFGMLTRLANCVWEGQLAFSPTRQATGVLIEAPESGPTQEQRVFWREIERRYDEVLPEIEESLHGYVLDSWGASGWTYELLDIEIPAECRTAPWTAQYLAHTDQDADMGYFVRLLHWKVIGVEAAD